MNPEEVPAEPLDVAMEEADLVEFRRARLAEDEQVARNATAGPWRVGDVVSELGIADVYGADDRVTSAYTQPCCSVGDATHIALHDPARALREVEAKRATVNDYERAIERRDRHAPATDSYRFWDARALALFLVLRREAALYADHPDYREKWKP